MNTVEILKAAKEKIINPENWMKGYYARDASGIECMGYEEGAVCFCGFGAIESVTGVAHATTGWPKAAELALSDAAGVHFADFNDHHTHEEVLAVFDKAIKSAQSDTIVENLEVLLAAVEAQPETLFDLNTFRKETPCGSNYCTVGLACTMPRFQAMGFHLEPISPSRSTAMVGDSRVYDCVAGEDDHGDEVPDASDFAFGFNAWLRLFEGAGGGDFDTELGYLYNYDTGTANMTDKELAVARLKKQIELLKE